MVRTPIDRARDCGAARTMRLRAMAVLSALVGTEAGAAVLVGAQSSEFAKSLAKGALIFASGDIVAQTLETRLAAIDRRGDGAIDRHRLSIATGLGTFHGGLVLPFVYGFAERLYPGVSVRNVLLKTAVSWTCLSVFGNYGNLFARQMLGVPPTSDEPLRARFERCAASVNRAFPAVFKSDLCVWPLYDLMCFAVLPPAIRPTATAVVSVCWHTYISYTSALAGAAEECASKRKAKLA